MCWVFSTKLDGKIQLEKNSKSSQRSELKELQEEKIWDERDLKRIANTLRTEDSKNTQFKVHCKYGEGKR